MIKNLMDKIITERKEKHIEDDYGIQDCWDKMVDILSKDIYETVEYLESCSEKEYIDCLRKLDKKYPNLNMTKDIDLAEEWGLRG